MNNIEISTTENMENVIKDLTTRYRTTESEIRKELSPEFDITQWKIHPHLGVSIHGEVFQIDEKIVNLFKLINKYEMNTMCSCQHNMFGWVSISFPMDGYLRFVNKILEKVREKYKDEWEKIYELNVLNRFQFDTKYGKKRIYTDCLFFDGRENIECTITVELLQSEISQLETELSEIFN